ncbi:hypothetical protein ERUR111494_06995 [Erysipelothrix urinaevulpis]|uniref:hypothetical protein n=1 Tax=Erysipelothrix urinaevulpis TaxID=2683717 RepID=UPI00135A38F2|nr:hypothetical protein [Erysipelothrix urinaevulpis]
MNSLDRIIGVLFKDIKFCELLKQFEKIKDPLGNVGLPNYNSSLNFLSKNQSNGLEFINDQYFEKIKKVYKTRYNFDYSDDELDILLSWIVNNMTNQPPKNNQQTRINTDSNYTGIDLIQYISSTYIKRNKGVATVTFNNLLEWDGFINKLDSNVFYSSYLYNNRLDPEENINHSLFVDHDAEDIKQLLREGISENHMHLKGSGYSVDLSWIAYVLDSFYKVDSFTKCVYSKTSGKTVRELQEENFAFNKLRYLHFYIWSLRESIPSEYKISSSEMIDLFTVRQQDRKEMIILLKKEPENYQEKNKKKIKSLEVRFKYLQNKFREWFESKTTTTYNIVQRRGNKNETALAPIIAQRVLYHIIIENYNNNFNQLDSFLFNMYITGINQFKLRLIHDNHNTGFGQFKEHENIKSNFIEHSDYFKGRNINQIIYESVFDKYYRDENVELIEFRVTPLNPTKLQKLVNDLDLINNKMFEHHNKINSKNRKKIDYGIICHYIKSNVEHNSGIEVDRFKIDKYEFDTEFTSMRKIYERKNKKFFKENTFDYYKDKIVGIDTANYELNCRPYLLSDIYQGHRLLNDFTSNIGFTYHVGEEFNTIVNGLRAIDEVICFLNFGRGDRLGHAIAMGLDVDKYFAAKRCKIHTSVEDYVDDIVWMFHIISKENNEHVSFLESEYEKYKMEFLPSRFETLSIHHYLTAYKLRSKKTRDICSSCFDNRISNKLYLEYHMNTEYKLEAKKKVVLEASDIYIDCVKMAQKLLREKITKLGVEIEANPSSNYKISYLRKRIDLPLFSFNSDGLWESNFKNLSVSINTDDSAIFQTNLSMEYALVAATLHKENIAYSAILKYLEKIRVISMRQSFINR